MTRRLRAAAAAAALALAAPARAHHGVAALGAGGPEGPGAAVETTSPLPLPQGTVFTMARSEYVPFQRTDAPAAKTFASFNTVAVGVGVAPWLSAYVFQPVNVKGQDGVGTNVGPGDTNVMLSLGLKWDDGLRLVPEKESLDDLMDWHLGVAVSSTLPVGPTGARGERGAYFAPDMQTGFGAPSATIGLSAMRQLTADLTWLAEASYQQFFPHTYRFTRYRFGAETRLNTALTWRVYGARRLRVDLAGELNGLRLERDRQVDGAGSLEPLRASGGEILYATAGVRTSIPPFSIALGVKRAALVSLNEASAQQGSEGLERLRAAFTVSYSTRW